MILKNRAKAFDDFLKLKCENFSLSRFSSNESTNVKDVLLKGILRFFQKKKVRCVFFKATFEMVLKQSSNWIIIFHLHSDLKKLAAMLYT